ncbi:hypothetical protein C8Q78DRAFT_1077878 [Trametes maxima]|nr:hypothetical protein C8Q78DRAFT_1077878 [Trametes maxima]
MLLQHSVSLLIAFTAVRAAYIARPSAVTWENIVQELAEQQDISPTVAVTSLENIEPTPPRTSQPGQSHYSAHSDGWDGQRPPLATARGTDLPLKTLLPAYPHLTGLSDSSASTAEWFPQPRDEDDASSAAEVSTSTVLGEQPTGSSSSSSSTLVTVSRSPTPSPQPEAQGDGHEESEGDSGRNSPYAQSLLVVVGILSALLFITLAMLAVLMKRRIYGNSPGRYHELRAQRSQVPVQTQDRPDTMYSATSEMPFVHHQPEPHAEGPDRVDSFRSRRTSVSSVSRYSQ